MSPRQFVFSLFLCAMLIAFILRSIQKDRLTVPYALIWLLCGFGATIVVLRFDWLLAFSGLIGAITPITTLFLLINVVFFLLNLQTSQALSLHQRQIKKLGQELALLREKLERQTPE
jgi:hypothetical protein